MTEPIQALKNGAALLIVEVQNDFCPGGRLPVPHGDRVVPVLNRWLAAAGAKGIPVYASRDWHPLDHISFKSRGGPWPAHCVQDTEGAAFHPDLVLPSDSVIISKGVRFDKDQYSAFDETGLAQRLREDGIEELWVGGLAQDVCVLATVLDACKENFRVYLIEDASYPLTAKDGEAAIEKMRAAGARVVHTD